MEKTGTDPPGFHSTTHAWKHAQCIHILTQYESQEAVRTLGARTQTKGADVMEGAEWQTATHTCTSRQQ